MESVWHPPQKFQDREWLHVLLFVLTVASTTLVGGWLYSATILAILGCHELGHYVACRHYDVDASLPYFLPVPITLTGTLGAFIRIREPIAYKRWLFDIGIAGPIAGFVIAVPTLFIGIALSHFEPLRPGQGLFLGEPLLLKFFSWIIWGRIPDSETLVLHPMAFAAWFGLLATALNLFPIGQLDGGHISYTVFGRRSTYVTFATIGVAIFLSYRSASWIVWTIVVTGMLFAFGVNHPRVIDEDAPLDTTRKVLAVVALVIFALCFTPAPIQQLFTGR
ncbi:MAG TPA: site-2 protease family protein [Vicinamibacterales bacterium]|nr:site-2 protease family protein [Vicinamibacterales bacterium]